VTREQIELREAQLLAPYAMPSGESAGRVHEEPEAAYRTCYQRDRDRVIHCKAFRRLEYKTQVFLNHEGDHYRTRLTHTIEVAQIARTIARALRLNEDLTEAIAMAHDLGHTPFGHSGEEALRELMAEHGGFEHNAQGLRVVDLLERQYPGFPGLNLTQEVRESIVKHSTRWDTPGAHDFPPGPPLLEAQVVELADSIAYDNHDLQDGLEARILTRSRLGEVDLWGEAEQAVKERYGRLNGSQLCKQAIRYLVNRLVTDAVESSTREIESRGLASWQDARRQDVNVVGLSHELNTRKSALEDFLYEVLYADYRVLRLTVSARRFVRMIFNAYVDDPRQLPPEQRRRAGQHGVHRAVCDYVAGMTDRFAQSTYVQLFHPFQTL
jgi:dGTPase